VLCDDYARLFGDIMPICLLPAAAFLKDLDQGEHQVALGAWRKEHPNRSCSCCMSSALFSGWPAARYAVSSRQSAVLAHTALCASAVLYGILLRGVLSATWICSSLSLAANRVVTYSRSTENLALSRDQQYHPYVPCFA